MILHGIDAIDYLYFINNQNQKLYVNKIGIQNKIQKSLKQLR